MSHDNENVKEEIEEVNGHKSKAHSPLQSSSSLRELLSDDTPKDKKIGLFSSYNFGILGSPTRKFWQIADERDQVSRFVLPPSTSHGLRERLRGVFPRKIDWESLRNICNEWFRNPMNMALFVWITCVAISGAILFLVMTGMLNSALPKKSQRNAWFEVNNQILNALFTLMCLYQHPKRFHHLVMLCRWKTEDISRLRKIYCKNGTYKPHEWAHMMVVVILLQINCFAQYALCGLNVGYKRSQRPVIGVAICISVAIGAPAIAGVYLIASPLGKEYDFHSDEEAQVHLSAGKQPAQLRLKSFEKRFSFAARDECMIVEDRPRWRGGILDFWDDISLAYLSLFCSFCVFGWNMERLGFGNMYVHIATFILFCTAPYWIFNLAAINIDNEVVRHALGVTGALLCVFGLLYGGYWRMRMRKQFNLPGYNFCCNKPAVADCALWLCCCWCSLAQEVRTGNVYDIVEDKFYRKQTDENIEMVGSLLPCEGSSSPVMIMAANYSSPGSGLMGHLGARSQLSSVDEESPAEGMVKTLKPPSPLLIKREGS
ncbi:hypothetical protein Nepgr_006901 [Nepenthes gracilis]|uniref:PLAC8 family protein n=1 Tax=Nepenthes gracilis TaxID=150966 RepID=A0AAD3S6E4_NEPGR|nr:hypothetical protein Nepgr_006901 [Nepenthes gracilis]